MVVKSNFIRRSALQHLHEGGHAGLDLAYVGLRVVGLHHSVGDALLLLHQLAHQRCLHVVGMAGL